jgi:RNase P/RNase MRP subunit POP5
MKALRPSMRENKRYLLVKCEKICDIRENIEKAILDFSGVLGMSKVGLSFIETKENSGKNSAIICINRQAVDLVRGALCVWPTKMEVLRVSGTLTGLRGKK